MGESGLFYRGCGKLGVGRGLAPAVLHRPNVLNRRIIGDFREGSPFYRGCGKLRVGRGLAPAVLHHTTVFTAKLSGHSREGSPFYHGCVRVERREQAPALHY